MFPKKIKVLQGDAEILCINVQTCLKNLQFLVSRKKASKKIRQKNEFPHHGITSISAQNDDINWSGMVCHTNSVWLGSILFVVKFDGSREWASNDTETCQSCVAVQRLSEPRHRDQRDHWRHEQEIQKLRVGVEKKSFTYTIYWLYPNFPMEPPMCTKDATFFAFASLSGNSLTAQMAMK